VQQAMKPGITENELFAILTYTNLRNNGERMDCKLLTAGGNTNPWPIRFASSRMVRYGDLVSIDTDMAGPLGYLPTCPAVISAGMGNQTRNSGMPIGWPTSSSKDPYLSSP